MAEISDKIPFDANHDWFLPSPKEMIHNEAFEKLEQNYKLQEKIISERCVSCIPFSELDYVIVDEAFVPITLSNPVLLSNGTLVVYSVSDHLQ